MLKIILFGAALAVLLFFGFTLLRRLSKAQSAPGGPQRQLPDPSTALPPASFSRGAKPVEEFGPHVPQEHVLRRHFMTHVRAMLCALTPCPTDSVLRRHHAHWLETQMAACLRDPVRWQRLEMDYRSVARA